MSDPIAVCVEATRRRAFARAADWPGWARGGKTEELALVALAASAARYAAVAVEAGEPFVPGILDVVERRPVSGTDRCPVRSRSWIVGPSMPPTPSGWSGS
jgi:hypothetical protein